MTEDAEMMQRLLDAEHTINEANSEDEGGYSRRKFMAGGIGAVAAGGLLAACGGDDGDDSASTGDADLDEALQASDLPEVSWDMATSWPLVLDTIWGGAEFLAEQVSAMTGGRFTINAAPGGCLLYTSPSPRDA